MFEKIVSEFFPNQEIDLLCKWGNGHINDTYKLKLKNDEKLYILQKINTSVFKTPQALIQNHLQLQSTVDLKTSGIEIPYLIPDSHNSYISIDEQNGYWRLMNFITDTHVVEVVEHNYQASEAGRAFGSFANMCSRLNAKDFKEAIPDFHSLSFRLSQFKEAVENDKVNRLSSVKSSIDFYLKRETQLIQIEELIKSGEIPIRVVHNDTKINNLLFREDKAVAVIDLDTVGPGSIFYDFGDALRTISNTADEDEKNLDLVKFNTESFLHFSKAYIVELTEILTVKEQENLHLAPILMTFIIGIRFLTDYLNGDIYFKTVYSDHNLIRSMVQMKLIEEMEAHQNFMINTINDIFKKVK